MNPNHIFDCSLFTLSEEGLMIYGEEAKFRTICRKTYLTIELLARKGMLKAGTALLMVPVEKVYIPRYAAFLINRVKDVDSGSNELCTEAILDAIRQMEVREVDAVYLEGLGHQCGVVKPAIEGWLKSLGGFEVIV